MNQNNEYEEQVRVVQEKMSNIKHKVMVMSGKGGVGKTTVAVNLAHALSKGASVGLLDTDINGPNVPKMLGIEDKKIVNTPAGLTPVNYEGIKVASIAFMLEDAGTPVIWRGPLKGNMILQFLSQVDWGNLDYLITDLPPGTGDEAITVAQLLPGMDGVVVVTTPQDVAILDSRKAINFARQLKLPVLGVIENMSGLSCPHCGEKISLFKEGGGEDVAKELSVNFLGKIPLQANIVESCDAGKPFSSGYSKTPAAEAFKNITRNITRTLNSS